MAESYRTGQMHRAHAVRLLGAVIVLLGFTGVVAAGAAQASQRGTAARSAWKVEGTPNQDRNGAGINVLSAVSCTSVRACTAVGSHAASLSSPGFTLAERWNGASWRIQPTILPSGAASATFAGVSCASATACVAVGSTPGKKADTSVSLAETWNGTSWRVQVIPAPRGSTSSSLFAVSCTSPSACTAVGDYSNAAGGVAGVAERWDGANWRIQPLPPLAKVTTQLSGVSCPAVRACTAVGFRNSGSGDARPLAEAWNGATWHVQAVPLPRKAPGGTLSAVSCTSPSACTATGTDFTAAGPTLAERWNGANWRVQPTPTPPNFTTSREEVALNSVSCTSNIACTATGAYAPGGHAAYFLEAWNGSSWRLVTAPRPAGFVAGALNGMSCVPARCTAVGAWLGGAISVATLAMAN